MTETGGLNGHGRNPFHLYRTPDIRVEPPGGLDVIDPRDAFREAPEYAPAYLPQIFEDYVQDCVASWGGDPGCYACSFMAMHAGLLHSSVKMNTNPLKPDNFKNPNDFSLILGRSGEAKSGMFKDLTRHQAAWQQATMRAQANNVTTGTNGARYPSMCFLQNASIEGMFMQIADNRGERLLMACEEAMQFYDGAALHHKENAANAMSNAVCAAYDGGMFSKRLVNKLYSIPEALATLIMTTVIDKITNWAGFNAMVDSGLMARHTISVIAHSQQRDQERLIAGADERMGHIVLKLRGFRDMRFVLNAEAAKKWLDWTARREQANLDLVTEKAPVGFINWWRKYDMRVMTCAVILQAYDFIEGGEIDCTARDLPRTEGDHEARIMRTVEISYPNLQRAVRFVGGYLSRMQEFFYRIASGVTEFGDELMNFLAYRITTDRPDEPERRILPRNDLTFRGPACLRGAITDERKTQHCRWIQALLDHGFIEVYEHPHARKLRQARLPNEERWFKVRDEVFKYFSSDADRKWLRMHYENSRVLNGAGGHEGERPVVDI